jgi:hypothetical protein
VNQTVLRRSSDVVSRRLGDRAVLIRLATSRVYELNATGARVWEIIEPGATPDAVISQLMVEFDGPRERLETDLNALVAALAAEGLLASS